MIRRGASPRDGQAGVSLLNTLVVVAIGAGLVQVMLTEQDRALSGLLRATEAAQARALAQAGVTSVAVALRRDLRTAPEADHLREPWARAAQQAITLPFGTYEVAIRDARGRFDLNALTPAALVEQRVFARLLSALDLPVAIGAAITRIVAQNGPLAQPEDLLRHGIAKVDLARLRPHVGAFSEPGPINLNAASEPVLVAVFANRAAARVLIARRQAKGFLEHTDLAALNLTLPPRAGFASDTFDVEATAKVGDARAILHRRLIRRPAQSQ